MTVSLVQQFSVTPRKLTEFMALVAEGSAMGEKAGEAASVGRQMYQRDHVFRRIAK